LSNYATEATSFRVTARPLPKLMKIVKLLSPIAARMLVHGNFP
jgi:hypothetical protein